MGSVWDSHIILRTSLLRRLRMAAPRFIMLCAPAGYGKSVLAAQFAETPEAPVCDCADVHDVLELSARMIQMLVNAAPQYAGTLSQTVVTLRDESRSTDERVAAAEATWQSPEITGACVIENCEHIAEHPLLAAVLTRLLAQTPDKRPIVICSRARLALTWSRLSLPHEVVTLGADDLRFDDREMAELAERTGAQSRHLERIATLSRGWPIGVRMLLRLSRDGALDGPLQSLEGIEFQALHEYLINQVFRTLDDQTKLVLNVGAWIPDAKVDDVAAVLDIESAAEAVQSAARSTPFLRVTTERVSIHPLAAAALHASDTGGRAALLDRAVAGHVKHERFLRAAQILFFADRREAAAGMLHRIEIAEARSPLPEYTELVASLGLTITARYPRLWAHRLVAERFAAPLNQQLSECETMWTNTGPETPALWRSYLRNMLSGTLISAGDHERALRVIDEHESTFHGTAPPRLIDQVAGIRLISVIKTGHYKDLEVRYRDRLNYEANPGVMQAIFLLHYSVYAARMAGDRAAETAIVYQARSLAERWGLRAQVAHADAEGAFGAWLADDQPALAHHMAGLNVGVVREGFRGFGFLLHALERRAEAAPWSGEEPTYLACAHIVRTVDSPEQKPSLAHAEAALAAARRAGFAFLEVLAQVILAWLQPEAGGAHLLEARSVAARIDEPAVAQAVERLQAGAPDAGILTPLVRRLSRVAPGPRTRISLLFGRVTRDGIAVTLRKRELELVLAIARYRHGISIQSVCDLLWPDETPRLARNAFRVNLVRLRHALGDATIVSRVQELVTLAPAIDIDLWDIEDVLAALRRLTAPQEQQLRLELLHQRLRDWQPELAPGWEWFAPTVRRIAEIDHEVSERLARLYLSSGEFSAALALADRMIERDPLDEPAHELRIRVLLAQGDRASAMRELRIYCEELRRELGIEPPGSLTSLVG